MDSIIEIFKQEGFLKSLFEAIPCGVLIVDESGRVHAINNVLEKSLGISGPEILHKRGGEAIRCVNSSISPRGCGFAEECKNCVVRATALKAINGKQQHRVRAKIQLMVNGRGRDHRYLVSAAPINYNSKRLAVILLEDITELNYLKRRLNAEQSFAGIIGQDPNMIDLFETIREVTDVNVPVLIQGESGTGKELVASAIHNEGIRSSKPFVPVNCAALPEGLLESELFGHVKGSFTGALRDKRGRFELAHGGTLFLDEIGDMSKVVQAKLLRVLQEGTFERVGDERRIAVDVRIVSATNRDLKVDVDRGRFREDLYYRLNVVPIEMPPLRKRRNDIPSLVDHFLKNAQKEGLESDGISKEALAMMLDYSWPGNVRELQSAIRFALVKSHGDFIQADHLPKELRITEKPAPSYGSSRKLDKKMVREALAKSGGNKAKAARMLGVGRATLYRFLSDFPDVS